MFPFEPAIVFLDALNNSHGIAPSPSIGGTVFPDEIMTEILSRVPAEPLNHFKTVNRAWNSLIRDKNFISKMHIPQMKKQNLTGYMLQAQYNLYPLGYRPGLLPHNRYNYRIRERNEPEVYILSSCEGLVLQTNSTDKFYLHNPSTGIMTMIPHSPIVFPAESSFASVVFGMGYDEDDDDDVFKILRVCCFNNLAQDTSVGLLNTSNMEWSHLGAFPYPCPPRHGGVFVGGCINWKADVGNRTEFIATFNCRTNQFGSIELPSSMDTVHYSGELGALDDDRLVFYSSICMTFPGFEMWVLGRYGAADSWVRYRFPLGGLLNLQDEALVIQPIRLMKPRDRSILFRIEPLDHYFLYDLDSATYEQLNAPVMHEDYCNVFPFVQSVIDPRYLRQ